MSDAAGVLDLSQDLLADEIRQVSESAWSGTLALAQGEVTKQLRFSSGRLAFATSSVEEDRLGAILHRGGKISEAQFRAAMRNSAAPGRHLGGALVEAGILSAAELDDAVAAQVERIALSVLRWTSGRAERQAPDGRFTGDLAGGLDARRLLVLGLRQFPDAPRLERQLGAPARRLRRRLPFPFDYEQLPVSPAERAVLAMCARPITLGELLAMPIARADLVRAVAALRAGGLIAEVPQEAVPETLAPAAAEPQASQAEAASGADHAAELVPEREAEASPADALRTARALLERGERARAILTLSDALQRHPADRGLRRLMVVTLSREGPFDPLVERQFTQALAGAPSDTDLRYELARYYLRHGVSARALLHLRLVLSVDPGHAAAWRDLGELEAGQRRS